MYKNSRQFAAQLLKPFDWINNHVYLVLLRADQTFVRMTNKIKINFYLQPERYSPHNSAVINHRPSTVLTRKGRTPPQDFLNLHSGCFQRFVLNSWRPKSFVTSLNIEGIFGNWGWKSSDQWKNFPRGKSGGYCNRNDAGFGARDTP